MHCWLTYRLWGNIYNIVCGVQGLFCLLGMMLCSKQPMAIDIDCQEVSFKEGYKSISGSSFKVIDLWVLSELLELVLEEIGENSHRIRFKGFQILS